MYYYRVKCDFILAIEYGNGKHIGKSIFHLHVSRSFDKKLYFHTSVRIVGPYKKESPEKDSQ